MFFPLSDDNDHCGHAWVTWAIIALNVGIFGIQCVKYGEAGFLGNDEAIAAWYKSWGLFAKHFYMDGGFTLAALWHDAALNTAYSGVDLPVWATIFTSIFMHADISHIGGNMLFLWIFGDNVEHAMGHVRFLLFYLIVGILGSLIYAYTSNPEAVLPSLGASGAIAGVMGAYMLFYPKKKVNVAYYFSYVHRGTTAVSAYVLIGGYLLLDLFGGLTSYGSTGGGTAFWAHIGGMGAGIALAYVFRDYSIILLDRMPNFIHLETDAEKQERRHRDKRWPFHTD